MLTPGETTVAMDLLKDVLAVARKEYIEQGNKELIPKGKLTNEGFVKTETTPESTPGKDLTPTSQ